MERWTSRDGSGYYHLHRIHGGKYEPTKKDLIQRVGQYEDTGKEPEIATYLIAAYRAATDLLAEYRALGPIDHLRELVQAEQDGRLVVQKIMPGEDIWVLERDEHGEPCDISGYMFLASAGQGCIVSPYVDDRDDLEGTIEYHIDMTALNCDSDLSVFPVEDCFTTRTEAEAALGAQKGGAEG